MIGIISRSRSQYVAMDDLAVIDVELQFQIRQAQIGDQVGAPS